MLVGRHLRRPRPHANKVRVVAYVRDRDSGRAYAKKYFAIKKIVSRAIVFVYDRVGLDLY